MKSTAKPSTDYHDYVFRDGQLVGDFEAMYRHSAVTPWHQDSQDDWIDVRLTVEMLRDLGRFEEIHDLGCGLGHYLALMRRHLGAANCRSFGYDISQTACSNARKTFPDFSFEQLDVTIAPGNDAPNVLPQSTSRRLFMMRALLWYVFPKLGEVVRMVRSRMAEGDTLLVVQNFPPLDRPFVGKDVMPDHHALIQWFAPSFVPVRHLWYEDPRKGSNDNWFIGLFSQSEAR